MLNEQTIEKLNAMRLNGMAEAFAEQLQQPGIAELSFEERFGLLVDRQWIFKEDRRMKRLLQTAKLRVAACIEDIDYKTPRGIDKSVILRLASCDWIRQAQNVIIAGPTGVGKTYLACALANSRGRPLDYGFTIVEKGDRHKNINESQLVTVSYLFMPVPIYHLHLSKNWQQPAVDPET